MQSRKHAEDCKLTMRGLRRENEDVFLSCDMRKNSFGADLSMDIAQN